MTVLTPTPARTDTRVASVPTSRTWALAGVVAGVTGAVGIVASSLVGAVYDESLAGDPDASRPAPGPARSPRPSPRPACSAPRWSASSAPA